MKLLFYLTLVTKERDRIIIIIIIIIFFFFDEKGNLLTR